MVPVVDELVLHAKLVREEVSESRHALLSHVVSVEVASLAVLDHVSALIILCKASVFEIPAEAELVVERLEHFIEEAIEAVAVILEQLLGIEVRDTLTADGASEHILMSINEGVDASIAKLLDHSIDLVKVLVVIDTW